MKTKPAITSGLPRSDRSQNLLDQPEYCLGRISAIAIGQPLPTDGPRSDQTIKDKFEAFEAIQETVRKMHMHFERQVVAALRVADKS